MSKLIAILDACVLYPAPLRDLLMHLALKELFQAKWTDEIHEEWIQNLLEKRKDLTLRQLYRTRDLMNSHVLDCLVEGYSDLIPTINLNDKNDRHIVAAAIKSHSSVIVTYNIKDFPNQILSEYNIKAQHPDEFICNLCDLSNLAVLRSVQNQRQNLKNPPLTPKELIEVFEKIQLDKFSSILKNHIEHI